MVPPGFSQRSRAAMTGTSIPSSMPNPPSHSETITSTRSGSSTSMMSPWITLDDVRDAVRGGQLLREDGDGRLLDRVDARGSCPRREEAQDAGSGTDVEHDVAGAHHRIDRSPERVGAHAVADHRAVHLDLRVHRVRWVPDRGTHARIVGCRSQLGGRPTTYQSAEQAGGSSPWVCGDGRGAERSSRLRRSSTTRTRRTPRRRRHPPRKQAQYAPPPAEPARSTLRRRRIRPSRSTTSPSCTRRVR